MKALVTGATGFIGSHLCAHLLKCGWEVAALIREGGRNLAPSLAAHVQAIRHDGTTPTVVGAIELFESDVVFHLASLFVAEHREDQVTELIQSNVLFGTQLLEGCAKSRVKHFINTGTSWQHYRRSSYDPVCLYSATKQAFENILVYYSDAWKMRTATVVLFDTYGPSDPRRKLVNLLVSGARTGQPLNLSPGEQHLDLVHVDDVVRAFTATSRWLLTEKPGEHCSFGVSSGATITPRGVVAILESIIGKKMNITWGGRPYRSREVMVPIVVEPVPPNWRTTRVLSESLRELLCGPDSHFQ